MKNIKKSIKLVLLALSFMATTGSLHAEVVSVGPDKGERCTKPLPTDIGYRPSLFECNGNAAILFKGEFRSAYSVVLRRNGFRNDRDRFNSACDTARCSPLKVQKTIELPSHQVNCLGDTGFGEEIGLANRISIKFRPDVTDSSDPAQFRQYCLFDKTKSIN